MQEYSRHIFTNDQFFYVNITDFGRQLVLEKIFDLSGKIAQVIQSNIGDKKLVISTRDIDHAIECADAIVKKLEMKAENIRIIGAVNPKGLLKGYKYFINYTTMCDSNEYYTSLLNRQVEWNSILVDCHLISLTRRITPDRAEFTKQILDLAGKKCRSSFGTHENSFNQTYFKQILHPYPFPMILDEYYYSEAHDNPGEILFRSLVNVVLETRVPGGDEIFVSEKTFKAFAWHQLPIWFTSFGHVKIVRDLGFDVFDDIFDGHKYDVPCGKEQHRFKVLLTIQKFLKQYPTIDDIRKLREQLWPRLEYNAKLLNFYYHENRKIFELSEFLFAL